MGSVFKLAVHVPRAESGGVGFKAVTAKKEADHEIGFCGPVTRDISALESDILHDPLFFPSSCLFGKEISDRAGGKL